MLILLSSAEIANESLRIIADHCANCEGSCILCCPYEGRVRLLEHGSNSRNLHSLHLGSRAQDCMIMGDNCTASGNVVMDESKRMHIIHPVIHLQTQRAFVTP